MLRKVGKTLCPVLGAMLLLPLLVGCPIDLVSLFLAPLAASASATPGTVDKVSQLTGSATGGTEPYIYEWTQTAGPSATVTGATLASATFTPAAAGMYAFRLAVTDSSGIPQVAEAYVDIAVGDIMFVVPAASDVAKPGNPALVRTTARSGWQSVNARARVLDPEFTDDQQTQMQVHYELVSVPTAARAEDVSLDREFDTISNQGTGDTDFEAVAGGSAQTLDGQVTFTLRANLDAVFSVLTNIATLVEAHGAQVPGDYTFRATVTNPNGVRRSRDLVVTLVVEGITGHAGAAGAYTAQSAGSDTIAVKELPAGSPGKVTDKVMTATQMPTMIVSVFPGTTTSYRFYLLDNNTVGHPEFVSSSPSSETVAATGSATDFTLTIGSASGMPTGTYELYVETFDELGTLNVAVPVEVNRTGGSGTGTPVRFHVTDDFYAATGINAAQVGGASNDVDAPVPYEGWSGTANYGAANALADVNLDGALDIITIDANGFAINKQSFIDGSTEALRHPDNSANFDGALFDPNDPNCIFVGVTTPNWLAAGDLNGDGLPDVAAAFTGTDVEIYFHTGNPAAPYSNAAHQSLIINPPDYTRQYEDADGVISENPLADFAVDGVAAPGAAGFGTRIAIADVSGDGEPDLIVTDPGFGILHEYNAFNITDGPADFSAFYDGAEGRVYVFDGGATSVLQPGRPQIITTVISEVGNLDSTQAAGQQALSVTVTEATADQKYSSAFTGGLFDEIGQSLAAASAFAVGSDLAIVDLTDNRPVFRLQFPDVTGGGAAYLFVDTEQLTTTVGGINRVYEFDNTAAWTGDVQVDISAAGADQPANALAALKAAINGDANRVVDAADDPVFPNTLLLTARVKFTYEDDIARTAAADANVTVAAGTGLTEAQKISADGTPGAVAADFDINQDGIVYRQGATALTDAIAGTLNSNMGLGRALAKGDFDGTGDNDDLVIAAQDSGAVGARNGDGAVFTVPNGATTLPAAVSDVGANTQDPDVNIPVTNLGWHVAIGDVNGDGLGEVFFTEPGFDSLYMIKGAATLATSPDLTINGVVFDTSLGGAGTFLFGDITGDTRADWVLTDGVVTIGFAGFAR